MKNKNILIVDDDVDSLEQMKLIVEAMGFQALTATNQKEGESVLEKEKPDLAIFDLMMENKDSGFILSYKSKKRYPDVPVIIASAVTAETGLIFSGESEETGHWIKADHFMDKGIRPDQLQQTIKRLLKVN